MLEKMLKDGYGVAEIAGVLGVHRDTIYKEFTRSGTDKDNYCADIGQKAL